MPKHTGQEDSHLLLGRRISSKRRLCANNGHMLRALKDSLTADREGTRPEGSSWLRSKAAVLCTGLALYRDWRPRAGAGRGGAAKRAEAWPPSVFPGCWAT